MIEVRNVVKNFGTLRALDNINFDVESGQIVGFVGANGAGKTTTMDIICGCLGADEGTVRVAGLDIMSQPIIAKEKLGYLPDNPPLYDDMIVRKGIEYSAVLNKVSKGKLSSQVDKVIDKLDLKSVEHRLIGNLSKGFRQRVAFAQALVHDPDVLVLDEPTEGLDPNQIVQMRELIKDLKGNHTIILSSHILSEVQHMCDRIVIIHKGRIAKTGTYEELIAGLQNEKHITLRVRDIKQGLEEKISLLEGVKNVCLQDEQNHSFDVVINHSSLNVVDDIAKVVLEENCGIEEIVLQTKNLEDVFFQVTH